MSTAHLISGLPCSGKTTYATALRQATAGVLFSLDYWLITLHGRYSILQIGHEEHVRRVLACRHLICDVASEFLMRGHDVILDDGFFLREHRIEQIRLFKSTMVKVKTHVVQVPMDVLRSRLERRNADLPPYNFAVNVALIEQFATMYELPTPDEDAELVLADGMSVQAAHHLTRPIC
jgi:predicted kinase